MKSKFLPPQETMSSRITHSGPGFFCLLFWYLAHAQYNFIYFFVKGLSNKDVGKNIVIDKALHLKLECNLVVDSMDSNINVSWRHGNEQISSSLYTYNYTDNQWRTTYEWVYYMCISPLNMIISKGQAGFHGESKQIIFRNKWFLCYIWSLLGKELLQVAKTVRGYLPYIAHTVICNQGLHMESTYNLEKTCKRQHDGSVFT